mgnify:CR=1 FL=1|tara:strand:- start:245 stop:403 length:159 start_codon:yes stop_codon:yes gene_type:complete
MELDYKAELMDAVEERRVSPELMIICLVKYLSQDDVKDCMKVIERMPDYWRT